VRSSLAPTVKDDPVILENLGLQRTGRFCGGICADLKRRAPWYLDDWIEGWRGGRKTILASVFMFFATLAPIIAFGAEVNANTKGEMGVVEYLISQGVGGIIWAVVAGTPMVILMPTGPVTLFTSQLYLLAQNLNVSFLVLNAWTGIFCGFYMFVTAVTDNCAIAQIITHFTEDIFGAFISIVFIYLGLENMVEKFTEPEEYSSTGQCLLTLCTLYVALKLCNFDSTAFFNGTIRGLIADLAVPVSVIIWTLVGDFLKGPLDMPLKPLPVPSSFEPTLGSRDWFVTGLGDGTCIWVGAIAAIPLFFLNFIDQNVTTLMTHTPENKLKKGGAFHWNLLILAILTAVLPLFGCPVTVGALPHSPQFAGALAQTEMVREDGVQKKKLIKVHENRISPLIVMALITASLSIIGSFTALPFCIICDALFLFMGVTGLPGNQLWERILLMFSQPSLYPPLPFTRAEVPLYQMHLFTAVQFIGFAVLFIVEESPIALAFPIFLVLIALTPKVLSKVSCGLISQKTVAKLDHQEHEEDAKEPQSKTYSIGERQSTTSSLTTSHKQTAKEGLLEEGNGALDRDGFTHVR
jgi:hypothetical protein